MGTAPIAAAVYFALIFGLGFVLGAIRVLLIAPLIGPVAAVFLEAPIMLAASWAAARWTAAILKVRPRGRERLIMGAGAFALIMAAEPALAVLVFKQTPAAYLAALGRPEGLIGLGMQALFGVIPYLQRAKGRPR